MRGGCTGAPAEGGKEGDEGLGGSKDEEPDAASRRLPPQPEGLMAKGSHSASPGLNGEPAPPCAHFLAWKPFAINAAPTHYLDTLLDPAAQVGEGPQLPVLLPEQRHQSIRMECPDRRSGVGEVFGQLPERLFEQADVDGAPLGQADRFHLGEVAGGAPGPRAAARSRS